MFEVREVLEAEPGQACTCSLPRLREEVAEEGGGDAGAWLWPAGRRRHGGRCGVRLCIRRGKRKGNKGTNMGMFADCGGNPGQGSMEVWAWTG